MRYKSPLLAAVLTLAACDTRFPSGHLSGPTAPVVGKPSTFGPDSVRFVVVHPGGMCIKSDVTFYTTFHASGDYGPGQLVIDTLKPVTWTSSDPHVATIDPQGRFKPVPGVGGAVTITATWKSLSGSMAATVDPLPDSIPLKCAAIGVS